MFLVEVLGEARYEILGLYPLLFGSCLSPEFFNRFARDWERIISGDSSVMAKFILLSFEIGTTLRFDGMPDCGRRLRFAKLMLELRFDCFWSLCVALPCLLLFGDFYGSFRNPFGLRASRLSPLLPMLRMSIVWPSCWLYPLWALISVCCLRFGFDRGDLRKDIWFCCESGDKAVVVCNVVVMLALRFGWAERFDAAIVCRNCE